MILPNAIQSITIITFGALSILFNYKFIRSEIKKKGIKTLFLISLWLLLLYVTILYSFESIAGIIYIKKSINLILIPFILLYAYPKLNGKKIEILLNVFIISSILFIVYTTFIILSNLFDYHEIVLRDKSFLDKITFIFTIPHSEFMWFGLKEAQPTSLMIHKTYLSLNLVFSIFIILEMHVKKAKPLLIKALWVFLLIFLSLPIFLFLSYLNIIILFIGLFLFGFNLLKTKRNRVFYVLSVFCFTILTFFFINKFSENKLDNSIIQKSITGKFNYIFSIFNNDKFAEKASIDSRRLILDCSLDLIKKKPVFGYGLGEQHIHLTSCYASKGNFVLMEGNYNSHNYYLFLLLSGGLMVFFPFCFMLFYFLQKAIKHKNYIFLGFLILIALNLLFENILSRINGIIFISLFIPLLYLYSDYKKLNKCN